MKKMFLLLTAALLAFTTCAFAAEPIVIDDANLAIDITMTLPEGYEMLREHSNGHLYLDLISPEESAAVYSIVIAHSEEYDGETMTTMPEEEIAHILAQMSMDFAAPEVKQMNTAEGTLVCVLEETDSASDYACVVTVYNGYFITVQFHHADYTELTEADVQIAIDLLSNMHFAARS